MGQIHAHTIQAVRNEEYVCEAVRVVSMLAVTGMRTSAVMVRSPSSRSFFDPLTLVDPHNFNLPLSLHSAASSQFPSFYLPVCPASTLFFSFLDPSP